MQCDLFNQILIYICFICSLQMSTFKCIFSRPAMIVLFSILTIYSVMWSTTKIRYYYPFLLRFHVYRIVFIRYYSLRLNLKLHIYKFRLRPVLLNFFYAEMITLFDSVTRFTTLVAEFFPIKTRTVVFILSNSTSEVNLLR